MKRIPLYILVLVGGWFLASCGNDWLDLSSQTNVETTKALKKVSDFEFINIGLYNLMQNKDWYGGRMMYYGDVTGDDMQAYSSTKRTGSFYLMYYNKDNVPSSFWNYGYKIIGNANIVINHIDELKLTDKDDVEHCKQLKAEALALRAMALFDLCRIYGYPYLKDNGASWGVAIVEGDILGIDYKPSRSTVADCYDKVVEYLNDAIPNMTTKHVNGRMNKYGAMTLLSRVYLYMGKNEEAYNTAITAIKEAESKGYRLWTNEEYVDVWSKAFSSEVFFELENTVLDGVGKEGMGYLTSPEGYRDMHVTSSFYAFMKNDPNDVRFKLLRIYSKRAYIQKYLPQDGEVVSDANIRVLRLSELYLNAAEAACKLGNNEDVLTYLEPIVKRGNPNNTLINEDEQAIISLERVLTERRKELFGEGHRMFDLLRNNLRVVRKNVSVSEISSTKHLSGLTDETKDYDWNFYKCVLAIPKYEMDANVNMKDQQNPGY